MWLLASDSCMVLVKSKNKVMQKFEMKSNMMFINKYKLKLLNKYFRTNIMLCLE